MEQSANEFKGGLVMDFDPMSSPETSMTSALNATIVTYNGNEYQLQNDMGNGRVETAYLPEGFVPVGTCSHGGIIYVASHNPLTGVSQVGSFPSPERNFGFEKDDTGSVCSIKDDSCHSKRDNKYYNVINIPIGEITLSPGDKFLVTIPKDQLSSMFGYVDGVKKDGVSSDEIPCVDLSIGVQQDGKTVELTGLRYFTSYQDGVSYDSIFTQVDKTGGGDIDLDSYRNVISSPYQIVSGSFSGKLCLIVKMKIIDSFEVKYTTKLEIDE